MGKIIKGLRKIILVDDDEDDRDLFSEAFENVKVQAELLLYKNGQELIDCIDEIDRSIPTFIFLDLNMPVLSGMEVLKRLKSTLCLKNIFVTMYSTSSSENDVESAYLNGANGYLIKPSSFNQLTRLILKTLTIGSDHTGKQLPKDKFMLNRD